VVLFYVTVGNTGVLFYVTVGNTVDEDQLNSALLPHVSEENEWKAADYKWLVIFVLYVNLRSHLCWGRSGAFRN
jgi:hypothetical protein